MYIFILVEKREISLYYKYMKKISVDRSSFEDLRKMDCIYVDKTEYVYKLVNNQSSSYYFISRPRRYGKSLMCSTLHCLFEGKKSLFKELYIGKTDYSFEKHPVLHFNFAEYNTTSYESFLNDFQVAIRDEAERNGIILEKSEPSTMLVAFLKKTEKKAVIIIDEYDTPIIHTYKNIGLADKIRDTLSMFYSVVKNRNEKIRFFFLTGITKFSNMSIFSQINNLIDLTFDKNFASAFGYTEEELESNFSEYIDNYMTRADRKYEKREDFLSAIKEYYDGYRFSYESNANVYNPVSVGFFFTNGCSFKNYWIDTGTSTLAVDLAKDYHLGHIITENPIVGMDVFSSFDYSNLASLSLDDSEVLALIYFTGYLTIKEGDNLALTLKFPNKEVRNAFTLSLMKQYSGGKDLSVFLVKGNIAIKNRDISGLVKAMNAYYAKIPYVVLEKEIGYEAMFYSYFLLFGVDKINVEETTTRGRIDVVIESEADVYIIEIKVDKSAEEALSQIKDKRYYAKYINTDKEIHIIGLNFASKDCQIAEWKEEIIDKTTESTYLA